MSGLDLCRCYVFSSSSCRYCTTEPEYATEFRNLLDLKSVGHEGASSAGGLQTVCLINYRPDTRFVWSYKLQCRLPVPEGGVLSCSLAWSLIVICLLGD